MNIRVLMKVILTKPAQMNPI